MKSASPKSAEGELKLPDLTANVNQLRQYLDPRYSVKKKSKEGKLAGTFNEVRFIKAPVIKTVESKRSKSKSVDVPFEVAVLTPKPRMKDRVEKEIKTMSDNLRSAESVVKKEEEQKKVKKEENESSGVIAEEEEETIREETKEVKKPAEVETINDLGVRSPFIQIFPYLGGVKISGREDYSLSTFLDKMEQGDLPKKVSDSINLQELFAQLMLGIHELHSKGLVHKDIKLSNILVTLYEDGRIHLQISDLDSVASTNDKTLAGTVAYYAPEVFVRDKKKLRFDITKYNEADKKALDMYALGVIFDETQRGVGRYQGFQLIAKLKEKNPDERFTIEQAMDDSFFGATPEARQAYFASVQKKFERPDVYYDSYYQAPADYYPELGDAFLLLPKALKEIYQVAADLNDTIKVFQQSASHLEQVIKETLCRQATLKQQDLIKETLYRQATRLHNLISKAGIRLPILFNLKIKANQVLAAVGEVSGLEIVSAANLKKIVSAALNEYTSINHLNGPTHRFFDVFKKHNQTGKALAAGLRRKIEALNNPSALTVFIEIDKHLAKSKGAWGKQSFKTILAKKLAEVSSLPFDHWPYYLSRTPAVIEELLAPLEEAKLSTPPAPKKSEPTL